MNSATMICTSFILGHLIQIPCLPFSYLFSMETHNNALLRSNITDKRWYFNYTLHNAEVSKKENDQTCIPSVKETVLKFFVIKKYFKT